MAKALIYNGDTAPISAGTTQPQAVYLAGEDKILFAYTGPDTKPYGVDIPLNAGRYHADPVKLSDNDSDGPSDTHGQPNLFFDGDVPHLLHGGHHTATNYDISDAPNTLAGGFTAQTDLFDSVYINSVPCPNGDTIHFVVQRPGVSTNERNLSYKRYDAQTGTFGSFVQIFDFNEWIYPGEWILSDDENSVWFPANKRDTNNNSRRDPYVFRFDLVNEKVFAPDGTDLTASIPLTLSDVDTHFLVESTP
jgi:hypothetical protein